MNESEDEKRERRKAARKLTHGQMHEAKRRFQTVLDNIDHDLERNDEVLGSLGLKP